MVLGDKTVTRVLDSRGLKDWKALAATTFFGKAVEAGHVVSSTEIPAPEGAAGALEHPRLPVITYPFEWTFGMLRDAARLQLDLMEQALGEGLILKDATPYNFQFPAGRPQLIDIGSFERYRTGEPWIGYRQFCRQFLYPLMLRAWCGVPFQPWLRGDPEGPTAAQMWNLLPARRKVSPAAMLHVGLQARAERRMSGQAVRQSLADAGFSSDLIVANVRKLRSLVDSLEVPEGGGAWAGYVECDHVARDRDSKAQFLSEVLDRLEPSIVLDLGANDGYFSLLAARKGSTAVAVDGDETVLDRLYSRLEPGTHLVPVVADLSNPSPSQGWAGEERPALFERAKPDVVIAYGLIHHLIYTASIPPAKVVEWLASFGAPVVVEFVSPEDPMVGKLTANKRPEELHDDRDRAGFERLARDHFTVAGELELAGGTRRLYSLEP